MFETTLIDAVNSASITVCNGHEISNIVVDLDGRVRLDCGEDCVALLDDQNIEIDADGMVTVPMHAGDETEALGLDPDANVTLEFKVAVPMRQEHLMVLA